MKNIKLTKIIASSLLITSVLTLNPIKVNAEWRQDNTGWWYAESDSWTTGWQQISNTWFYFNDNGYMEKGWLLNNEKWYFLSSDGVMQTGLIKVDGKTYYLGLNGDMQTGNIDINGEMYRFTTSGEVIGDKIPQFNKEFLNDGIKITTYTQQTTEEVTSEKKTAEISLKGNPTTGCDWEYNVGTNGIIKEDLKEYKPYTLEKNIVGSGGVYIWKFSSLKEGTTEITFKYYQPWEKEKIYETKTYICSIDKNLNIHIKEK